MSRRLSQQERTDAQTPLDCPMCTEFTTKLETLAMGGRSWLARGNLTLMFRLAHHDYILPYPELWSEESRAYLMLSSLKKEGWPHDDLRNIAELVAEVGL